MTFKPGDRVRAKDEGHPCWGREGRITRIKRLGYHRIHQVRIDGSPAIWGFAEWNLTLADSTEGGDKA